jgi:hypothetical protein
MDMRKDIVRTRNRKEEGTSNSAKARRRLRDQLLAKGAYTKVEFECIAHEKMYENEQDDSSPIQFPCLIINAKNTNTL